MQAKDIMTREVVSIRPDASILEAARLMLQHKISGLPVVGAGGSLVGIVTEGDFLRRAETGTGRHRPRWLEFILGPGRLAEEYVQAAGRRVDDVMTSTVRSVAEGAPLEDVVHIMERYRVKRVPVLRNGAIVGIITRANLLRAVARLALEAQPASADDAAIRKRLLADLDKQSWAPVASIDVAVNNGVVKFTGLLYDERQRQALRVAAENIPGVKGVEDQLVWVEPVSGMVFEGS